MASQPTRYYVEYLDGEGFEAAQQAEYGGADPRPFTHRENFDDLGAAQDFKTPKAAQTYAAIYERSNIVDVTPRELRRLGIKWYSADFDEELIED